MRASSSVSSFSMKEHPVSGHHNPTETLIEREIRLQREREEAGGGKVKPVAFHTAGAAGADESDTARNF